MEISIYKQKFHVRKSKPVRSYCLFSRLMAKKNFFPNQILLRISSTAFEQVLFLGLDSHKFSLATFERWRSGGKSSRRIFYSCIASIVAYLWQIFGQLFMQCANFMQAMWYVLRTPPRSLPPPPCTTFTTIPVRMLKNLCSDCKA